MAILAFAQDVDAINFNSYIVSIMNIRDRLDFVDTMEYILTSNRSLWFTSYGFLYCKYYDRGDCKLGKPDRTTNQTYTVVIYNRYQ
jgi:hypothetical protein